jgi:hypothetical protein
MVPGWSNLFLHLLFAALPFAQAPTPIAADDLNRVKRIEALRAQAKEHIEEEGTVYSVDQLQDIEARYRSAHQQDFPMFLRQDAAPILRELVATYLKSNRAGCAVLDLAHLASGKLREQYLREAIANHNDAWCESGVQVGALARAHLAVGYAHLGVLSEAERLAKELVTMFPDAIDESGAPLKDVLEGVRLLK